MEYNIRDLGAKGDGVTDDYDAIQLALDSGSVYVPEGRYLISKTLTNAVPHLPVAIRGDGSAVSKIIAAGRGDAIRLSLVNEGIRQPYGCQVSGLGLEARGLAGRGIAVSLGNPAQTSEHFEPTVEIRNVVVSSGGNGSFSDGIDIESAWNTTLSNVFVSGNPHGGNWNLMSGNGIRLRKMCVNTHLTNVRTNFWATGICVQGEMSGNTEGLFCSNCSMVGVQRGVWITGAPVQGAARMSTFTWQGGMIECRVAGVEGGSAAFHLVNVWTALINGCQMLSEALPTTHTTYGMFIDNCHGVVVSGNDINAWHHGVFTVGDCRAINVSNNTYTNVGNLVSFNPGTTRSKQSGNVSPYADV